MRVRETTTEGLQIIFASIEILARLYARCSVPSSPSAVTTLTRFPAISERVRLIVKQKSAVLDRLNKHCLM